MLWAPMSRSYERHVYKHDPDSSASESRGGHNAERPPSVASIRNTRQSVTMMSCSAGAVNAYRGSTFTSRGARDLAGKRTSAVAAPLSSRRTGLQVSAKGKGGGRRSGQSSRPGGQPSMYV